MKMGMMSRLTALAITASSLLYSGCASMPTPVKVLATPVALARDVPDMPLTLLATGLDYFSNVNRQRKDCKLEQNMFQYRSLIGKQEFNLCEFGAEFSTDLIGGLDYCLFRWPSKQRPWKSECNTLGEHLFPTTKYIWAEPWENPFTNKKERL